MTTLDTYVAELMRHEPLQARLWTALYLKPGCHCFNVEIGQYNGPLLTKETALRLALNYLNNHQTDLPNYLLVRVSAGSRREKHW